MELVEGPRQQRGELRESRVRLRDGGCPHADGAAASTVGVCSVSSWIFTERLAFPTQATYQKLLPLYFPRSLREESRSLPYLPADIGNADGEPVVPERQIRISEKPGAPEGESCLSTFLLEAKGQASRDPGGSARPSGNCQCDCAVRTNLGVSQCPIKAISSSHC